MALLLAPYNEAMRIGMGFNSYTQQLCVNDVVRRSGGRKASESDLRQVDLKKEVPPARSSTHQAAVLSQPSGTVLKTSSDGESNVSQVVSWEAGFVDNVSDVYNSLSISGALKITSAAIAGGGGADAHFNDTTRFINSDARYKITVKVTNQKLIADDVTEFTPIANVPDSKFNEIYGDSFISGFIEGGVLNALVLRKLEDEYSKKNIGGGLKVEMDLKFVNVSGSAKGEKNDISRKTKVDTSINISWSGGGDIKPDNVEEWDVETLTKVAMEFPDKVALCPQRTYAILTKYSSLRSFHEQTVKGSPLDYEIAGIYTSALLDSYMDYKAMWGDLLQTIKEVEHGESAVKARPSDPKLVEHAKLVKDDYDKRMVRFNAAKNALTQSPSLGSQITLEEPLPPNAVEPYSVDSFGLDKAARECRFEMIKIVREVNEVTFDPKVATDPYRDWRFLSPNVFRLLLPTDKAPQPSPEEIAKTKADLDKAVEEGRQRQIRIDDLSKQLMQTRLEKDELEKSSKQPLEKQAAASDENSVSIARLEKELANAKNEKLSSDKLWAEKEEKATADIESLKKKIADLESGSKDSSVERTAAFEENKATVARLEKELAEAKKEKDSKEKIWGERNREAYDNNKRLEGEIERLRHDNKVHGASVDKESAKVTRLEEELAKGKNEKTSSDKVWLEKDNQATAEIKKLKETLEQLQATNSTQEAAQSGHVNTCAMAISRPFKNQSHGIETKFTSPFRSVPRMLYGLNMIDIEKNTRRSVGADIADNTLTKQGFTATLRNFGDNQSNNIGMSWLAIPENDIHMESGIVSTYSSVAPGTMSAWQPKVFFAKAFKGTPKVLCWFYEHNSNAGGWFNFRVSAENIHDDCFELKLETWAGGRNFDGARVGWFAYDAAEDGKRVRSGVVRVNREVGFQTGAANFYGGSFAKTPASFMAISTLDFGLNFNIRADAAFSRVSKDSVDWAYGTRLDSNMDHMEVTWIAVDL